jgi:hypothetical protein
MAAVTVPPSGSPHTKVESLFNLVAVHGFRRFDFRPAELTLKEVFATPVPFIYVCIMNVSFSVAFV